MTDTGQENESNIYLGQDGAYHDDTEENRERFPAAEDAADEQLDAVADAQGGEPVPFTDGGQIDGGQVLESGTDAPPAQQPAPAEAPPAPAEAQPAAPAPAAPTPRQQ